MMINRENYESFFLDYLEGSLDSAMMEEFRAFLIKNTDLNRELEEFELIHLNADPISYREKEQLKKPLTTTAIIHDEEFDQLCIGMIEGNLNPEQERKLNDHLKGRPQKQMELKLFHKTRLKPSLVIFPDKHLLKRKEPAFWRKYPWYSISAAASVILILLFSILLEPFRGSDEEQIASTTQDVKETETTIQDVRSENENGVNPMADEVSEMTDSHESNIILDEPTTDLISRLNQETNIQNELPVLESSDMVSDDRATNMKPLTRRDIEQIGIPMFGTLTALKVTNQEVEATNDFLTVREYLTQILKGPVKTDEAARPEDTDKVTFLDVADAGVRGISRLPGVNMQLNRSYGEDGELASYAFTSRNLSFFREVKK